MFGSFPGAYHVTVDGQIGNLERKVQASLQSGGSRPIDHFRDQCRLISIGHGINDAGFFGLAGQQGTGQNVGLDIDHDNMLLMFAALEIVNIPIPRR